jgi:hypothetical protein
MDASLLCADFWQRSLDDQDISYKRSAAVRSLAATRGTVWRYIALDRGNPSEALRHRAIQRMKNGERRICFSEA